MQPDPSSTDRRWTSKLHFLLAAVGLAVGPGNVWRFPYMMGQHGGSAFLVIYVVFILLLAVPALAAEWSLGRATRRGPVAAFRAAYGPRAGLVIGLLYGAVFAPAVWSAVRSTSVAGISATTWLLAWIEAVVWMVYGSSTLDLALITGGIGGTVMSSIILARLLAAGAGTSIVPRPNRGLERVA